MIPFAAEDHSRGRPPLATVALRVIAGGASSVRRLAHLEWWGE